jgi:uncharacterized protein (TIGR02246 family)
MRDGSKIGEGGGLVSATLAPDPLVCYCGKSKGGRHSYHTICRNADFALPLRQIVAWFYVLPKEADVRSRVVLGVFLSLVLLLGACQQPVDSFIEEDITAIRAAAEQEVVEAMLAGDWERFAASFTEDAVRLPPDEPLHRGRAAIKRWAEENWGPLMLTEFSMTVQDVDGCGDLAYAWGPYSAIVKVPELDDPVKDVGKFLTVLRKQADGAWLVSVAMFNSDIPLPGSPEEATGEESAE